MRNQSKTDEKEKSEVVLQGRRKRDVGGGRDDKEQAKREKAQEEK